VIEELIKNKIYKQITRNICHNHELLEDLHSEAIIVIIEKQIDFSTIRNLRHYFSTVCWLTWHSNKFRKRYFVEHVTFVDNLNEIVEQNDNIDYSALISFLNDSPQTENEFYEQNLLKLYIQHGDAKKLSDKTKIPYRTVANDIKKIKEKLKRQHNEKNSNQSEHGEP
jgi:DNA-directed RNA polymerase specialized sigma24 family protein